MPCWRKNSASSKNPVSHLVRLESRKLQRNVLVVNSQFLKFRIPLALHILLHMCTRVLHLPHKFENYFCRGNFYFSSSWKLRTKTLLVKFRKNLSMFRGGTVASQFWQFQNKSVCFVLNVFGL